MLYREVERNTRVRQVISPVCVQVFRLGWKVFSAIGRSQQLVVDMSEPWPCYTTMHIRWPEHLDILVDEPRFCKVKHLDQA